MFRTQAKRKLRAFGINFFVFSLTGPIFEFITTELLITKHNVLGLLMVLPIIYALGIAPAAIAGLLNFAISELHIYRVNTKPPSITGAVSGFISALLLNAPFLTKGFEHFSKGAWLFLICIISGWLCALISNRVAYNHVDKK